MGLNGCAMGLTALNLPSFEFRYRKEKGKLQVFDRIRKKYVALTPEEWVRQHVVRYLIEYKGYPGQLMRIESTIKGNLIQYRGDIVVYRRTLDPCLIVECKAPGINITNAVFNQVLRYNIKLGVEYLLVTNGLAHYCFQVDPVSRTLSFLSDIPDYTEITGPR